jgi:inhibitor of cysteine peptidase
MKRVSALIIGLIIIAGLIVGGLACGKSGNKSTEAPKQVSVEVSYDEFQKASASTGGSVTKTIEVPPDGILVVSLWSNKTTGFSWSESATISDPGVLQQTNHEYVAPEAQGLVGAPGKEVWTFKALKVGTSQVSMEYSQPWEGGQKDAYGFSLTVTVK